MIRGLATFLGFFAQAMNYTLTIFAYALVATLHFISIFSILNGLPYVFLDLLFGAGARHWPQNHGDPRAACESSGLAGPRSPTGGPAHGVSQRAC